MRNDNIRRLAEMVSRQRDGEHASKVVLAGCVAWPEQMRPILDIPGLSERSLAALVPIATGLALRRPTCQPQVRAMWLAVQRDHPSARPAEDLRLQKRDLGARYLCG
jgi:hypothetical protein